MTARPPTGPAVTFWGAAREVTGSMHLVRAGRRSVLVDCGLVQGRRRAARDRNAAFPFKPKAVAAVVLTHAHVDHCGNLPTLVKRGFAGPVFATPATRALAAVMLGDAAKVQAEDAAYLNARRGPGEPAVEPLYDARDVYRVLVKVNAVGYGERFPVAPGVDASFHEAGHLLGAAMVRLDLGGRSVTFTGDVGRPNLPLTRPPGPVPAADLVVCESTYGGHAHEPVEESADRLGEVVRRAVGRGGKVIAPAFAVGRTQAVVYHLDRLRRAGKIPDVPVFVDSPMAVRATEVYRAHPDGLPDDVAAELAADPEALGDRRVTYVEKVHDSVALNHRAEPCVIVSSSGMCEAGRVLHHLKHHLGDPRSAVVLTGFQAADTLGRRLADGAAEVRVLGRAVAVKAEVAKLVGLSGHADQPGLVDLLSPLAGTGAAVRLVHGEPDRAEALADALRAAGFADVGVPERGESAAVGRPG